MTIPELIKTVSDNISKEKNIKINRVIEDLYDLHDFMHYDCRMSNEDKGQVWFDMICELEAIKE
jgi:hypothetical protein